MSKILIIDDEEANVRILSLSLRSDGYEVVTAHDGVEGLETFRRESPQIVLTDIRMPGMDGIEVLKSIRALEPDVEVIIFTGHGDIDHAIEALKYGASDFINKPIRDEALSIALQRAHEKIEIKRRLKDHMSNLEEQVQMATRELRRKTNFLSKVITSSTNAIVATDEPSRYRRSFLRRAQLSKGPRGYGVDGNRGGGQGRNGDPRAVFGLFPSGKPQGGGLCCFSSGFERY